MSMIKRGAMAMAVLALIGAAVPAIVGFNDPGVQGSRNTVGGPPQSEDVRGLLTGNEITAQLGTVTPEQVSAMFQLAGADSSLHANGTYEDPQYREERIAGEINAGLRTEAEVRQAVISLAADQQQQATQPQSIDEIVERVRGFFAAAGVPIQTSIESEGDRLARIARQTAAGERTLAEVQWTIQRIAAGTVWFDPNGPVRFGGSGVRTISADIDGGVNSVPAVPSTTTTVAAVTGVAAPSTTVPAPTTTTAAAVVTTTTAAPKSAAAAPAPVPTVLGGVAVFAGDSIQAAVNANPAGAKFVIKSGVHRRQSVQPKDGNVFVGEPGAVLTGENVTEFAFYGSGDNVTITGLVVEKYNNPQQTGAIYSSKGAAGWIVDGNEIRYNNGIGLKAGSGWKVLNNYVHHNTQLGLGGSGSNILVQGNEIAYNNYQKTVNPFWGGGGTKWVKTRNLVVRGNFSHHNHGPGLWTDIDNDGVLYEGNRVEDNYHAGIKHEISYSAVIRNNTLKRNGFGNPNDVKGAGILVANSPNVEVYGNTLVGNSHGIGAVQHDRYGDPADWKSLGEFELKNLYVHDNYIEQPAGQTGFFVAAGPHGDKPLTSWNNRFQNNTYKLGTNPQPFRWQYSLITAAQWKAHGQDTTGTFQ